MLQIQIIISTIFNYFVNFFKKEDASLIEASIIISDIDNLFILLTDLLNSPEFERFNVYDFYTKKTKLHSVIILINNIRTRYKTDLFNKTIISNYLLEIKYNYENYDKILFVLEECISKSLNNQKMFIILRNTIASEWLRRNITESKFLKSDLNILNYTFDQYRKHLEHCKWMLIYDVEKFINRYNKDHSKYIEVETEIRRSINSLIYNKVSFKEIDTKIEDLKNKQAGKYNKVTLRGWFKKEEIVSSLEIFNVLEYTAYKRA